MTQAILKVETSRVRVSEWRLPPGDATGHPIHEYDYVVVSLTGAGPTGEHALPRGLAIEAHDVKLVLVSARKRSDVEVPR